MARANGSNKNLVEKVASQTSAPPAKPKEKEQTIFELIEKMKPQFARALPRHMDVDRLARIYLTEIRKNPQLQACTSSSLLGAMMLSAQLGLEPGPLGQAYLIPFFNKHTGKYECSFIIGYQGYLDLVRRSGEVQSIAVRPVYEGDYFDFQYGLDETLVHKPDLDADPDDKKITHAYGVVRFKDGGYQILVMSRKQIEKIRARSKAANSGPWVTDWGAMALKTVVRQMWKFLPKSIELQRAVASDEGVADALADDDGKTIDITITPNIPDEEPVPDQPPATEPQAAEEPKQT